MRMEINLSLGERVWLLVALKKLSSENISPGDKRLLSRLWEKLSKGIK